MDIEFNCYECPGEKLCVNSTESGKIWFEISALISDIPQILLTAADARKLAHAILAEIGEAP